MVQQNWRHHWMSGNLWGIVPAAGSGSRFSATALKQYQKIQDKTVLEHTIDRLNTLELTGYVIAISENDVLAKTLAFSHQERAHFCSGGQERVHSVLNALNYLSQFASDDDLVFVHDAARPCVTESCLRELVQTAQHEQSSAILAIPVRDTLKLASQNEIQQTVSRDHLWQAQTPQISKIGILKAAIEHALQNGLNITDEASALEFSGHPVKIVHGRSDNIKITYPDDLELADLILSAQH
ncbi:2-C-methyl-D-erythritol 4-phosphate cytidylyltransferase [Acinetobacter sp. WCHAc010052]|uniref:2-C-methyl-D-erythritol 4-phosphate cytidylyltransferase n=1 Tax=Acinetobacter sp. WCHAc010052 TaxID=2004647 RepID=UPI0026C93E39